MYRDPEEAFLVDSSTVILVDLNDLLNSGTNGNEEPPGLSQLVD
jgi:hypothetical protein